MLVGRSLDGRPSAYTSIHPPVRTSVRLLIIDEELEVDVRLDLFTHAKLNKENFGGFNE